MTTLDDELAEIRDAWGLNDPVLLGSQVEIARLLAAVDAVLAVHVPVEALNTRHNIKQQVCTGCGADDGNWQVWPCPTVSAITTALTSTPNPLNSKSKDATP